MTENLIQLEVESPELHSAILRAEKTRIKTFIGVFAAMLAVVVVRGGISLAQGRTGEAWPFAVLLAGATAYEVVWLRFIKRAIESKQTVSLSRWRINILIESLPPTLGLFIQMHSPSLEPSRAVTSPVVLAYFFLIILSTLHLNVHLSRFAGAVSALGYALAAMYIFVRFPDMATTQKLWTIGASFSSTALLLIGGFAAGAVAEQIRLYVVSALREAASRAKFENDLGIARTIQQGLLPSAPPQIDGFDIAGWNQPADETGGDYYDWQPLADGRLAVTIADVSGHGIGPALCMSACRAYARMGFPLEFDLKAALTRLNSALCEDLPSGKFVTLATGVLNPGEGVLQLISAGHGPLLFYSAAEDRFHDYAAQGVPLGILKSFGYTAPHVLQFGPGDMLVMVTDGFTEWADADDVDFGIPRIQDTIRAHRTKAAAEIISELYLAVRKFSGGTPQLDDLTAVIVKRA